MDTSNEYILMCKKAKEIQRKWKKQGQFGAGTFVFRKDNFTYNKIGAKDDRTIFCVKHSYSDFEETNIRKGIFLPRQDQLQDMLLLPKNTKLDSIFSLNGIFCVHMATHMNKFLTMEQHWLSFVMKEKYNKEWDGKEWIKYEN